MTKEEMRAIRAAMYQRSENEPEVAPAAAVSAPMDMESKFEISGKFVTLTIDGKKISLPSVEYVTHLEKIITDQDRAFLRIKSEMKRFRAKLNEITSEINGVQRELGRKINMRDMP